MEIYNIYAHKINYFPNKPWFLRVCKKEKFLVTSNFSFSQSVFILYYHRLNCKDWRQ